MSNVVDLDVLKPEPRIVKIGGKSIDVSFIPCGITFSIDQIIRKLSKVKPEEIETTSDAFDLTVELCATFVAHEYPEMDEAWFRKNTSAGQIKMFAEAVKDALMASYRGIEEYGKN